MVAVKVEQGGVFHNKFGRYRHQDMIGMKYGSKVSLIQRSDNVCLCMR